MVMFIRGISTRIFTNQRITQIFLLHHDSCNSFNCVQLAKYSCKNSSNYPYRVLLFSCLMVMFIRGISTRIFTNQRITQIFLLHHDSCNSFNFVKLAKHSCKNSSNYPYRVLLFSCLMVMFIRGISTRIFTN
ncbi:hypothetical protein LX99_04354 [Mucilaginibacter oryzae]|uniref:Uncharacterized protein n=1 Tax=Mucilaginibacter oryzae TaxID=468058 RepID=A0A316H057_9SPHI|nr:hypothetical protein LX99_04354 [Mucilaginibacter oryzae]